MLSLTSAHLSRCGANVGGGGNGVKCVSNAKDKCLNLKDIFVLVKLIN